MDGECDFFLTMFRGETTAGETGGEVERTIRGDRDGGGITFLGEDKSVDVGPIDRDGDCVVVC